MNKNNFMHWLITLAVIAACMSVIYYYTFYLPNNTERKTQLISATNLDLQKKCSEQARLVHSNKKARADAISGFTNHYSEKMNKCFMQEEVAFCDTDMCANLKTLTDAFEGKVYGTYIKDTPRNKANSDLGFMGCSVTLATEEKPCNSAKEFDELSKYYMQ